MLNGVGTLGDRPARCRARAVTHPVPSDSAPNRIMAKILVVDDEPELRAIYRKALEDSGHLVIEARDGVEAMAILEAQPISVVVADVVMPKMGGRELAWRLATLRPQTRVILVSGILPPDHMPIEDETVPANYLVKPFEPRELVKAVESALR